MAIYYKIVCNFTNLFENTLEVNCKVDIIYFATAFNGYKLIYNKFMAAKCFHRPGGSRSARRGALQIEEIIMATASQVSYAANIKSMVELSIKGDAYFDAECVATIISAQSSEFWIVHQSAFLNVTPHSAKILAILAVAFDVSVPSISAPELAGSANQIAFATSIRDVFFKIYTAAWPRLAAHLVDVASASSRDRWSVSVDELDALLAKIADQPSAKFWIENKAALIGGWVTPLRGIARVRA